MSLYFCGLVIPDGDLGPVPPAPQCNRGANVSLDLEQLVLLIVTNVSWVPTVVVS